MIKKNWNFFIHYYLNFTFLVKDFVYVLLLLYNWLQDNFPFGTIKLNWAELI